MHESRPFWESAYAAGDETSTFGEPSREIVDLQPALPRGASVLDLGCGDGRHALYLARHGHDVTALDVSEAAIRKIRRLATASALALDLRAVDMRVHGIEHSYDLILAHGSLHLIPREEWTVLMERIRAHTKPGGYNVIAVFTGALPPPDDLRPFLVGLFREGELFDRYRDWEVQEARSYVLEDVHPGNLRHRHPVNKLVARKPLTACPPSAPIHPVV